jgi:hypothetical protein
VRSDGLGGAKPEPCLTTRPPRSLGTRLDRWEPRRGRRVDGDTRPRWMTERERRVLPVQDASRGAAFLWCFATHFRAPRFRRENRRARIGLDLPCRHRSGAKPTEVDGTRRCLKPRHRRPRWIPGEPALLDLGGFPKRAPSEDGEPRRFTRVHERRQTCKRNGFQIGSKLVSLAWFYVVVALPIGVRPLACAARACGLRRRRLDRRRTVRGAGRPGRACGSC